MPRRMKIDGRVRLLTNRIYCLMCSPFGSGNHTKLHIRNPRQPVYDDRICINCGRIFHSRDGKIRKNCSYCSVKKHRYKIKVMAVEYKGGKCSRCGYRKSIRALEFHHLDPEHKEFCIAGSHLSWESIRKELDKCDIVCSNCHAEIEEELDSLSSIRVMPSADNRQTAVRLGSQGPTFAPLAQSD